MRTRPQRGSMPQAGSPDRPRRIPPKGGTGPFASLRSITDSAPLTLSTPICLSIIPPVRPRGARRGFPITKAPTPSTITGYCQHARPFSSLLSRGPPPILDTSAWDALETDGYRRPKGGCAPVLDQEALVHLEKLMEELRNASSACLQSRATWATILLILSGSELLALYSAGSRRTAGQRGSRALQDFITRYFPRFNSSARDAHGHYFRVRIPLLREHGKATKRLKIPAALVHLFRRGVVGDLAAPADTDCQQCVILGQGKWGFLIHPYLLHQDFKDAMAAFFTDVQKDPACAARFLRRFRHLHG